jgi:hypothetical protein
MVKDYLPYIIPSGLQTEQKASRRNAVTPAAVGHMGDGSTIHRTISFVS